MPSFTWDHDPSAFTIPLPFPLKYVFFAFLALGLISAVVSIKAKQSPGFGLAVAAATAVAAFKFGDYQEPIPIRWYSLLFVGVFLGGYALLKWQVERGGGDPDDAGDFIVYGVLGVLVGSRLGHVLFYDLEKALHDPFWVLQIWTGGLASHGAVAGLIIAMYLFTKRRGIPFLEGADRFAFSAALGATLVRIGNFINSEIVGRKVPDQSWGVRFPRYFDSTINMHDGQVDPIPLRYPTQAFEVLLGIVILIALFVVDRRAGKEERPRGLLIAVFFALYFPGRFLVEFWKEFQTKTDGTGFMNLTMGQQLSIPGAVLGFYGIYWALQKRYPVGWKSRDEFEDEDFDDEDFDDEGLDDEDDDLDDDAPRKRTAKKKPAKKSGGKTAASKTAASKTAAKASSSKQTAADDEAPAAPKKKKKKKKSGATAKSNPKPAPQAAPEAEKKPSSKAKPATDDADDDDD